MKKMIKILKQILSVLPMICELLKYFQEWFSKWFLPENPQDSLSMMENDVNVVNEKSGDENPVKIVKTTLQKRNKRPNKLKRL